VALVASLRDQPRDYHVLSLRPVVEATVTKIVYVGGPLHRTTCSLRDEEAPKAVAYFVQPGVPVQYFLADASASGISPIDVSSLVGGDPEVDTSRVYVYGGSLT
jgi:hypothetical protein